MKKVSLNKWKHIIILPVLLLILISNATPTYASGRFQNNGAYNGQYTDANTSGRNSSASGDTDWNTIADDNKQFLSEFEDNYKKDGVTEEGEQAAISQISKNVRWLTNVVIAVANITSMFIVIFNIMRLGQTNGMPWARQQAINGLIKSVICTVILCCSSFFYYAFLYFMVK